MTSLEQFSDHIWTVFAPVTVAGMKMGTRATIIRLPSGRLLIISPVGFADDTATAIEALGVVDTIVAPNLFHHLYFNDACRRWPDARALIPTGLGDEVDLVDRAVEMGHRGRVEDAIHWLAVDGAPAVGEHLFIDPRDGVLVISDIAFNYRDHPQWWLRIFMRLNGVYGHFGPSRLLRSQVKDDERFGQSLAEALEYSWDAIVVAHGRPIESGGRQLFTSGFAKYLSQ